jgi:hypothetical protein
MRLRFQHDHKRSRSQLPPSGKAVDPLKLEPGTRKCEATAGSAEFVMAREAAEPVARLRRNTS